MSRTKKSIVPQTNVVSEIVEEDNFQMEEEVKPSKNGNISLNEQLKIFLRKSIDISIEENDTPEFFIPTGINLLDKILGGGIPNRLVMLIGEPGSGKTTLTGKILAAGQKKWGDKFISVYIDTEQSITQDRLNKLGCFEKVTIINDEVSIEKVFKILDNLCVFKEKNNLLEYPSCIIWDSIANTLSEENLKDSEVPRGIDDIPKILKYLLPRVISKLKKYNISFICVNQLRDKIDTNAYGGSEKQLFFLASNKKVPGGRSLIHNCTQIIYLKQKEKIEEYGFKGVKVLIYTVKNKCFTPNIVIESVYDFVHGFQNFWTDYEFLKNTGKITLNGGWVSLLGYSGQKCFQKEIMNKYKEDPEFRKVWVSNLKDSINEEFSLEKLSKNSEDIIDI